MVIICHHCQHHHKYNHAQANIALHVANISIYLENPAGIGEHSDIMEAMQCELDKIAAHEDRLDILNNYFNEI